MTTRSKFVLALGALGFALAAVHSAHAQSYPGKPIKLIVPFSAGGQPDVMARLIAQHLSSSLGPVVVENRPGAGGTLGAKAVVSAEPDGHTLLLGTTGVLGLAPAFYKDAGYDPIKSFAPVAMISHAPARSTRRAGKWRLVAYPSQSRQATTVLPRPRRRGLEMF